MATLIEQVRTLTSDKYQYDRAVQIGDGVAVDYGLPNPPVRASTEKVYVNGVLFVSPGQYTIDNDLGVVSFAAPPAANLEVVFTYNWSLLSDGDVQIFLDINSDDPLFAAAAALETIATNEALVQKVIKILDLTVDGAKVADSLRVHAKALREQATSGVPGDASDPGFDYAEMVVDPFSWRERIWAEIQRGSM